MSDKIEFDDFANEEAIKKFIAYGIKINEVFTQAELSIKGAAEQLKGVLNSMPKTVGDVEALDKSIKKAAEYTKTLEKIQTAKKSLQEEDQRARVEEIRLQQDREKAMDKFNERLQKEAAAKEKAAQQAVAAAEKERLAQIKLAQDREKAMDKFEKQIQKQASYPAQLRAMQREMIALIDKGVKPGEKSFDDLAKKAGALKDKIGDAKALIGAFAADSKTAVAKNLFGQIGSDIASLDFEGAADKAKQFAVVMSSITFKETLNGIKALGSSLLDVGKAILGNPLIALAAVIAAVTYAAHNMVTAFQKVEYQTLAVSDAIIAQRKLLEDYANRLVSANIKIAQSIGQISKAQSDQLQEGIKNRKENVDLQQKYKDDLIKLSEELGVSLVTFEMDRIKATATQNYSALKNIERFQKEKAKLDAMYKRTFIGLTQAQTKEMLAIEIQGNIDRADEAKKARQKMIDDAKKGNKELEDFNKKLRDLRTENIDSDWEEEKKRLFDQFDDEVKHYKGHNDIIIELKKKLRHDLQAVDDKYFQNELDKQKDHDDKMVAQDTKKYDNSLSVFIKNEEKRLKEEEDARHKEVEDMLSTADKVLTIYESYYQKLAALRREAIDNEIDERQSNIEIQAGLAARGLDNTMAYEMKKKDEAEKARIEEIEREKQHAKAMEAIELGLAFIKAYENYVSKGDNGLQALGKATRDIAAAKILATLIAGSAEKGTEDTGEYQGPGLDGKGGRLWMLHPKEGVANKEGNQKYKGAVGAINDGTLEDWAMKNIYKPQFESPFIIGGSEKENVDSKLVATFVEEVRDLKKVIENKKETEIWWDTLGDLLIEVRKNGQTKRRRRKTHLFNK